MKRKKRRRREEETARRRDGEERERERETRKKKKTFIENRTTNFRAVEDRTLAVILLSAFFFFYYYFSPNKTKKAKQVPKQHFKQHVFSHTLFCFFLRKKKLQLREDIIFFFVGYIVCVSLLYELVCVQMLLTSHIKTYSDNIPKKKNIRVFVHSCGSLCITVCVCVWSERNRKKNFTLGHTHATNPTKIFPRVLFFFFFFFLRLAATPWTWTKHDSSTNCNGCVAFFFF